MASKHAVRAALSLLAVNFAGEVSEEKAKLWAAALKDVSDDQLDAAIPAVIRTHRGEFIPPVAVVRDAAGANGTADGVDVERLLDDIQDLAVYNPHGTTMPRVQIVAEKFGPAVGEAYAIAGGGSRLFGGDETTRNIAARDFQKALMAAGRSVRIPPQYAVGAVAAIPDLPRLPRPMRTAGNPGPATNPMLDA